MMQQTILQISQEIDQQKQALTQQVEGAFAQYLQPSAPQLTVVQKRSIPPISYILGGIAAFCCVSSLISMTGEKASITKGVVSRHRRWELTKQQNLHNILPALPLLRNKP